MKVKLYLCGAILLAITIITITSTYALFETNANADADFTIGKWVIKLNNKNISLEKIITLDDFTYVNSTHVEDGYFAPTSKAEFEIDIDASNTDVSVEYTLDIDDSSLDDYPNIYFKIIDLDNNIEMNASSTSGLMLLSDTNRTKHFKLILEWENDEQYDESDTSLIDQELRFTMNANFKQYLGE